MAGVYTDQRLDLFQTWKGLRKKAKVSNRTREIWPSGIMPPPRIVHRYTTMSEALP